MDIEFFRAKVNSKNIIDHTTPSEECSGVLGVICTTIDIDIGAIWIYLVSQKFIFSEEGINGQTLTYFVF